jgi:hypothetical protein
MGIPLYNPATDNEENTVSPETPSAQLILQMFSEQLAVLEEKAVKTSHTSSSTTHARNMSSAVRLVFSILLSAERARLRCGTAVQGTLVL